ncbi:MAG TPA: AraC family transcriptional regulator [Micromonosporaceae bacterium]
MTATDTFAEFVSVLSAYLDDHDLRGDDLAARLHLSRSHFDRIISAVAGEAPGRFRRRILLERAAFLLRTSQLSVLEVAVEAGYSSHEAFTRAFQRAYGIAPTAWRTSSAAVHLPAPNGVHFYPPGGLRLPTREQVAAMPFLPALIDHHVHVLGQLLDRVAGLRDEQLDSPVRLPSPGIDDDPTIRSLLSRLIGQMDMWNRAMANQPYDFGVERGEPVSSMRARLASAGAAFAAYVREATEQERLDETFVDATCDEPFMFTAGGMIGHVLTYAAYRRTAVVCTLAVLGVADVEDDPLTWFAPVRP